LSIATAQPSSAHTFITTSHSITTNATLNNTPYPAVHAFDPNRIKTAYQPPDTLKIPSRTRRLQPSFMTAFLASILVVSVPKLLPAAESDTPDTPVACDLQNRVVLVRSADCHRMRGTPRARQHAVSDTDSTWATFSEATGIILTPVLACRLTGPLQELASTNPENVPALAQVAVIRGNCTRLARSTSFAVVLRVGGFLQIRTPGLGRLWVSENFRIPNLSQIPLARARLTPDSSPPQATGLVPSEQREIQDQLRLLKTHPAYGRQIRHDAVSDDITLLHWSAILGSRSSDHPKHDGVGLDRCAKVSVRYSGEGSRLVSPSSFVARFEDGTDRRGIRFSRKVRLSKGQSASGTVCFGGNIFTNIIDVQLR